LNSRIFNVKQFENGYEILIMKQFR